ncbi:MAG: glycerophosphodiester phosphodiesterase, partial [Alcanivoracaceae bacterium]
MFCMPVAIVGHRGARGEAPENTLASFQLAIDAGVPEIELDVRLSSDGHLIVLHDKDVDRTTTVRGGAQKY